MSRQAKWLSLRSRKMGKRVITLLGAWRIHSAFRAGGVKHSSKPTLLLPGRRELGSFMVAGQNGFHLSVFSKSGVTLSSLRPWGKPCLLLSTPGELGSGSCLHHRLFYCCTRVHSSAQVGNSHTAR